MLLQPSVSEGPDWTVGLGPGSNTLAHLGRPSVLQIPRFFVSKNPPVRVRPIDPEVAGDTQIPVTYLAERLGRTAFSVWIDMALHRSGDGGLFHGTLANIGKRINKTERAVRHVMHRRLIRSGIVQNLGRQRFLVMEGRQAIDKLVQGRIVRGAYVDNDTVVVPNEVAQWLAKANTHGGLNAEDKNRNKAYQGKSIANPKLVQKHGPLLGVGMHKKDPKTFDGKVKKAQDRDPSGAHVGPSGAPTRDPSGATDIYKTLEKRPESGLKTGQGPNGSAPDSSDFRMFRNIKNPNERQLGKPKKHTLAPLIMGGVVPPFPSRSLIDPPTSPTPPLLSPDMNEVERVRELVKVYNAAVSKKLGVDSYAYVRGDITKCKPYKALLVAANILIDKKISPWGWCAWRFEQRIADGRKDRPPITVIFGNKLLGNRALRNIYRKHSNAYGGRAYMPPTLKKLLVKYRHMQSDIRQQAMSFKIETEADLSALVAKHFPPGDWGILVSTAKREAENKRQEYARALTTGEFIW